MDNKHFCPMTPFDNLISSKPLRMIKLLLPYTPPTKQRMLAFYVKFIELQNTMDFFKNFGNDLHSCGFDNKIASPLDVLEEMRPFMDEEEGDAINNILSMMNMMEMVNSFQDMAGNENTSNTDNGFNPMNLMKGLLTPEQQNMFDTYSTMFSNNDTTESEGDENDE